MIFVALFYDALKIVFAATIIVPTLIDIAAFLNFALWFKLYGIKFNSAKRYLSFGGGFIVGLFPIINDLPETTCSVAFILWDVRKQEKMLASRNPA